MNIETIIIIVLLLLLYHFVLKSREAQSKNQASADSNKNNSQNKCAEQHEKVEINKNSQYDENVKKGESGEHEVKNILKDLSHEEYAVINNLMLKNGDSYTQIDHVIISVYGIFVIETKNIDGWIFGSEKDKSWTIQLPYKKYQIYNPIKQNKSHINVLMKYLKPFGKLNYISIIAFPESCELKKVTIDNKEKTHVVYYDELLQAISEHKEQSAEKDLVYLMTKWLEFFNVYSEENRKKHIDEIEKYIMRYNIKIEYKICPWCGKRLENKSGVYGPYLSCSDYPDCNFTASLNALEKTNL